MIPHMPRYRNAQAGRPIWHGSEQEAAELLEAVGRHCQCQGQEGERRTPCAPHAMIFSDQRALDGLLFARRPVDRLRTEEFRRPRRTQRRLAASPETTVH